MEFKKGAAVLKVFIFIVFCGFLPVHTSKEASARQSAPRGEKPLSSQREQELIRSLAFLSTSWTEFVFRRNRLSEEIKKARDKLLQAYSDLDKGPSEGELYRAKRDRLEKIAAEIDSLLIEFKKAEESERKISNQIDKTRAELRALLPDEQKGSGN